LATSFPSNASNCESKFSFALYGSEKQQARLSYKYLQQIDHTQEPYLHWSMILGIKQQNSAKTASNVNRKRTKR